MKLLYAFLFILIFGANAQAQKIEKPFFYELDYHGQKSYILGTLHVGVSAEELPKAILDIQKQSRINLGEMEVDFNDPEDISFSKKITTDSSSYIMKVFSKLHPNHNVTMTSDQIQFFKDQGIPEEFAVYMDVLDCGFFWYNAKYLFPKLISLDIELLARVIDLKIPYEGLDTPVSNFIKQSIESYILKTDDTNCKMINQIPLYVEYQKALNQMLENYRLSTYDTESELDVTTGLRNIYWLRKLLPEIQKGNAFIFVGLGHLLDNRDTSLLNIFEKQGIKVRRLSNSSTN